MTKQSMFQCMLFVQCGIFFYYAACKNVHTVNGLEHMKEIKVQLSCLISTC